MADSVRKVTVLNVDDTRDSLRVKTHTLRRAGFDVLEASTGAQALRLAHERRPDLVLLDVNLPDISGLEVCRRIRSNPETASALVVQISACFTNSQDQTRGLEGGADGYLTAPVEPPLLVATLKSLLRLRRPDSLMQAAASGRMAQSVTPSEATWRQELELGDDQRLISRSPSMQRIMQLLPQIAASNSTVLLLGETGTGKEMVARAIHRLSPRSSRPFVAVNCGALPDTLLESELFGYKAGAFTGALRNKPGRFAIAHDGTVFLDEIGDMSPALQVKLLRVLQSKTYEPLGGTGTETTEARILAATNRDLPSLVRQSSFRSDLYYRINVVRLELPPLRERREDIPALVDQLVARFNRASSRGVTGVSQESMAVLLAHDFPGNIRELENIIEHAFVLCPGGPIELDHLPEEMRRPSVAAPPSSTLGSAVKSQEAIAIMEALQRNDFNRLAAARELGIHKSTLFRKLKALGLDLPEVDGRCRSK